eukprot:4105187-Amphidinium_carterae.1
MVPNTACGTGAVPGVQFSFALHMRQRWCIHSIYGRDRETANLKPPSTAVQIHSYSVLHAWPMPCIMSAISQICDTNNVYLQGLYLIPMTQPGMVFRSSMQHEVYWIPYGL